jgi:hypothetical protein
VKNLFVILIFFPFAVKAQRNVDLDRYNFTVQYRSLPAIKLDSNYRTFSVEIESTKLMQPLLNEMHPENNVLLEGWRKMESGGHITVNVQLEDLLPESVSVKERVENIKDKNGQVTGTRTFYSEEVIYTFAATAAINDYKGIHIMDEALASRSYKQVYKSPEFQVKALAQGYFAINALSVTRNLYEKCVTNAMHNLSERITTNFGFPIVTAHDFMWIIDSKKDPEYTAHRQAFLTLADVLFGMNANTSIEGAKEQLKPVIDYFEKVKHLYTSSNKHDRKIRYASYYNLAVLNYYLDDPQQMMREANGLELNNFDAGDAKGFQQTATWLKNIFVQSNIYTRHFAIDTAFFKGPYEKDAVTTAH